MNGKQLKNSILQWAIQGKLVPQDPNDEPASVLLERIREEKARLVKEKKIKKDKNESIIFRGDNNSHYEKFVDGTVKCIDDEIPFEIPEGWEWVRISTIAVSQLGKTLDRGKDIGQECPYLCSINVYYDGIDLSKVKRFKLRDDELSRYRLQRGDLLICEGGDYGRCCVWDREEEMYYQNALHRVRFYCGLLPTFYKYVFELYRKIGYIVGQGQTIKHFTYESMKSLMFPLPPIEDQHRIVSKIEELLPLINRYDSSQCELDELNCSIQTRLKKSILQEAIQGKLVPQNPDDEPGSVLLERIKAEKAKLFQAGTLKKKDLADSVIFKGEDNKYYEQVGSEVNSIEDTISFDIPSNWQWVRLNDICEYIQRGKSPKYSEIKKIPVVAQKCNQWSGFSLEKALFMDPNTLNSYGSERFLVHGDLLWNSTGLGTLGRMAMYNETINPYGIAVADSHVTVIRPLKNLISSEYLFYYFSSHEVQSVIEDKAEGSTKQKELSTKTIKSYLIPLPPLSEQERIVNSIHQLFSKLTC